VFSGVFIDEDDHGVGDRVSDSTTMVKVKALFEAFLNKSTRSACFIDEAVSSLKAKPPHSPQVPDCQDFPINECHIKGILV
jgi:hypothetical protein